MDDDKSMVMVTCRCGQSMKVPSAAIGKTYKCVRCAERFTISPENATPIAREAPPTGPEPEQDPGGPSTGSVSKPQDKRVGQLLLREGIVTAQQVQEALAVQAQRGGKIFEILVSLGHLSKADLHTFLSRQAGVASIDLKHYEIPIELLSLIPREFAKEHVVLPIDKMGKHLTVGMACPLDTDTIGELERITGLRVKAMLCTFDDIHAALDRFYPSEARLFYGVAASALRSSPGKASAASRAEAVALLDQVEALPVLSGTLRHMKEAMETPGASVREVAGIVCADPAATAKVLSVANSTAYGQAGRVAHINLAAALLGLGGTCTVVRMLETVPPIASEAHFDYRSLWLRSMFCAAAAMAIAKVSGRAKVGDAYTAGLLHEIGRVALATVLPNPCAQVGGDLVASELLRAEEDVFGLPHPEAGYLMARRWRLPEAIVNPIRYHHKPEAAQGSRDLVAIVALAAAMADAFERKEPPADRAKRRQPFLEYLGFEESAALDIYESTAATLRHAAERKT